MNENYELYGAVILVLIWGVYLGVLVYGVYQLKHIRVAMRAVLDEIQGRTQEKHVQVGVQMTEIYKRLDATRSDLKRHENRINMVTAAVLDPGETDVED